MDETVQSKRTGISRRLLLGLGLGGVSVGAAGLVFRKLGFLGIVRKVAEVAPESLLPGATPDPLSLERGLVGAPVSRLDAPLKVKGLARFAAEVPLAGMVYASFAHSTIARGRIATLDTIAAERAPGVVLVMTYRNAPRMHSGAAGSADELPIMQDEQIYWNGQPIAVVLAESQEQADYARSLIVATYNSEPAVTNFSEAKAHIREVSYFGEPLNNEIGDAEAALAAAPVKVDQTYSTPFQNHNAMEPHAATLAWNGDSLVVHDCTQGVTQAAQVLAKSFGLKEKQILISAPFVGGGFGGK